MIYTLLSLPPDFAESFETIFSSSRNQIFASSDPKGTHLGSGGGTAWILSQFNKSTSSIGIKKILIHAGGQSRRLPAYAACGKILTPLPVFRWETGQSLDQTLLDVQLSLYKKIAKRTNANQNTIIASGDVLLRCPTLPQKIPQADVVCITTWIDSSTATHHGVLFAKRNSPDECDFMLQKPSAQMIEKLLATHVFMMDTGCWILSDKAVDVLMKKCGWNGRSFTGKIPIEYDFYTSFGRSLGMHPVKKDAEISKLTCALVNLDNGEFYHYGTTRELVSSTERIQNLVTDPRTILQKKVKAHPSIFVQNADVQISWHETMRNIWIENSYVPATWNLTSENVITGVPRNNWSVTLSSGICIDMVPLAKGNYCIRPYGFDDIFRGSVSDGATKWMGRSISSWFKNRGLKLSDAEIAKDVDIQQAKLFPVVSQKQIAGTAEKIVRFMIDEAPNLEDADAWLLSKKVSADDLLSIADAPKLFLQRNSFMKNDLSLLAKNYRKSVFYQSNLYTAARLFVKNKVPLPPKIGEDADNITKMRDSMFRAEVLSLLNKTSAPYEAKAFKDLSYEIISSAGKSNPQYNVLPDQIVWGRSPARIDLAGGWSDTPPYSIYNGGSVVNIAIDLNGQQPIQTYIRPIQEHCFILRSIDTGVSEKVTSYRQLLSFNKVGSSFSIPKAALCLAGFSEEFSQKKYDTLERQLAVLGGGLEITLLSAIPKGSGLGTSSILAATLLGTLSEICSLGWSKEDICYRTFVLEQLLTTGGGWQDQFGGVFGGIKICSTNPGVQKNVTIRKLPRDVFTDVSNSGLWLLYYTGITRVAKNILSQIVRNMFLNRQETLDNTDQIKIHADTLATAIQQGSYETVSELIKKSWELNKTLDRGTTNFLIEKMIALIEPYTAGYKLAGAGGGGYMLICAKDIECAAQIKKILTAHPVNNKSRFVAMSLNTEGLVITRS